jgi:HAE1 family hydrophobic/amphiphilic exporter-1
VLVGFLGFTDLPRRLNPEVKIPIVAVTTVLPGAGPDEIESLVTIPIEEAIKGVENVNTYQSFSQENVSVLSIEFSSDTDPDEAKSDVQSAIDGVNDLPQDAIEPQVLGLDFENIPVLTISVKTNTGDIPSLLLFTDELRDKLESDAAIDRVEISGNENKEIQIYVDPSKLYSYNINPFLLANQLQTSLKSYPAGNITTQTSNISVSVSKSIESIEDIRNTPILVNNNLVKLGGIAEVSEKSSPNQYISYIANKEETAQRAVTLSVFKSQGSNIEDASEIAVTIANDEVNKFDSKFSLFEISNSANLIQDQFNDLYESFALTLILVFITLFVFLGIRQSIIVSFSIPLTFLISFFVMWISGLSLNFLSVFSLLLALGLVVDDAIVIISASTTYFKTGKYRADEAGILVWKDFIVPIWSTTITTVWAFIPLLLSTGIIGEFIKTIPTVVSATLLASTSVAVLVILPLIMISFNLSIPNRVKVLLRLSLFSILVAMFIIAIPKEPAGLFALGLILYVLFLIVTYDARFQYAKMINKRVNLKSLKVFLSKYATGGIIDTNKLSKRYFNFICAVLDKTHLRRRVLLITFSFALFSYLLVPLGFVKNEFFPKIGGNNLYVVLELPSGSNRKTTEKESLRILDELRTIEEVSFAVNDIGRSGVGFGFGSQDSENTSTISLVLVNEEARDKNSIEIAKQLRSKYSDYSTGKLSIVEESAGPPVGADLELKIIGDNLEDLDIFANKAVKFLENEAGITNIEKSIEPSTSKLSFIVNNFDLTQNSTSNDQIGFWLRTFASGFKLANARFEDQEKEIVFRMNKGVPEPEKLGTVLIPTRRGNLQLSTIGEFSLEPNPTLITREDGRRTISVLATVEDGFSVSDANTKLEAFAENDLELTDEYVWKTSGVNEENQNSVESIFQAMIISALLILATMVIQLGSFRKSVIVLLVIPLAISGVFIIFALTNTPLSFPALIGVLALFGIVVNNSIVIVEKINQNLKAGIKLQSAISDASASRVEPIMLSSLTTIMGLIPITISDPLWRGLGGAIISGLTVSGIIMLIFIPVVYYSWFKGEYK